MDVPFIKIGSGDANNVLLLRKAAKMNIPLVISTGMQTTETIENIVNIMQANNKTDYALLHCISSYPTEAEDCSLPVITNLKTRHPNVVIGYSGHEKGIEISKAAVLLGARIIERHFTLNCNQKGSDHKCSLEPHAFEQLVKDIRRLEKLGIFSKEQIINKLNSTEVEVALKDLQFRKILQCEIACKRKLGKSIVAAKHLKAGDELKLGDLCIKVSEPIGISPEYFDTVLGKKLAFNVEEDMPLIFNQICSNSRLRPELQFLR
ncbi:sialic acid synthase-like [Eurosta solidaginis]|uniref:sialic acid synthase-like n=1 Tax=Eurosta solidaginis TaxID=178769 RepID=UPI003530DD1F